jgi:N utilization substance protein B
MQDQEQPFVNPFPEEPDEWLELESMQGGVDRPKHKLGLQRRQARSIALQTLFESDAVNHNPDTVLARHVETDGLSVDTAQFARLLVEGVIGHRDKLDNLISSSAPSWPMDQMAKVDKNILRLAIFEILFNNDVPVKAAINEAIELAKNFGSESSSRFVNGVLGAIVTQNSRNRNEQPA